jgi:hypothetical protein
MSGIRNSEHGLSGPEPAPAERPLARRGSLLQTLKAVAWAFMGIRGRGAHEADIANLNPLHLIIVAIVCAAVFVTSLLFIVRWAVGDAG